MLEDVYNILTIEITIHIYSFSTAIGVPQKTTGTMFTPIKVDMTCYEPERVGGNNYLLVQKW